MSNVGAIHVKEDCIFCKIIQGTVPSLKLYETELSYAFLDIGPASEGHSLVIPKYHAEKLHQVPDEHLADSLIVAKKVALAIGCEDYNILQNNGKIAFQHVFHVHFHIIPKPSEKEGLPFHKIAEEWPALQGKVLSRETLLTVQQKILANLN